MGDGAFSNVYKAIERKSGQKCAVKVVRKYELNHSQVRKLSGCLVFFFFFSFSFPPPRSPPMRWPRMGPRWRGRLYACFSSFPSDRQSGFTMHWTKERMATDRVRRMGTSISMKSSRKDRGSQRLVTFHSRCRVPLVETPPLCCGPLLFDSRSLALERRRRGYRPFPFALCGLAAGAHVPHHCRRRVL